MAEVRDIRVQVILSAAEFVTLKALADEEDLSQSAFFRRLLKQAAKEAAIAAQQEEAA